MKRPNEFQLLVMFTIFVGALILMLVILPIFWRNV